MALLEPHSLGWTGHLFQSSSQRAAFLTFLSSNGPPVSDIKNDDFPALFVLWDALRRRSITETRAEARASQAIYSPASSQPINENLMPSFRLQRRQLANEEAAQATAASSTLVEASLGSTSAETVAQNEANNLGAAGGADKALESATADTNSSSASNGKSTPAPTSSKALQKPAAKKGESAIDAGMKGLLIILSMACFLGIFLFIRCKFVSQPQTQVSTVPVMMPPPDMASYDGGVDITGPLGHGDGAKAIRSERAGYQIPLKNELGTEKKKINVRRPDPALRPENPGKTHPSLPSSVKLAKQRTAPLKLKNISSIPRKNNKG